MIGTISGPGGPATIPCPTNPAGVSAGRGTSFTDTLEGMLQGVNQAQLVGDRAIERLQGGGVEHLHEVMIAVEEAEVSLRMLVQMRNRAQTAYDEIMRMQI